MNRKFITLFSAAATLFFLLPQAVDAKIYIAKSLEWISVDAPLIVRGTVTDVKPTKDVFPEQPFWKVEEVTVTVTETLKGDHQPTITWRWLNSSVESAWQWRTDGHERLFFLTHGQENYHGVNLSKDWVLYSSYPYLPIDLVDVPKAPVAADMTAIKDPQQILEKVKSRVKHQATVELPQVAQPATNVGFAYHAPNGGVQLAVPEDSSAYPVLSQGSACFLIVPADEEYKKIAMEWVRAKNYALRIKGAQILSAFPDEDTINVLKGLLEDPATEEMTEHSSSAGERKYQMFGVRKAAFQALSRLGVTVEKPEFEK